MMFTETRDLRRLAQFNGDAVGDVAEFDWSRYAHIPAAAERLLSELREKFRDAVAEKYPGLAFEVGESRRLEFGKHPHVVLSVRAV